MAAELVDRQCPQGRTESLSQRLRLTDAFTGSNEVTGHRVEARFVHQNDVSDESFAPELGDRRFERRPPFGGRRRPEQLGRQLQGHRIHHERSISGAARVLHGVDRRFPRRVETARVPLQLHESQPHDGERLVVATHFELGPRGSQLRSEVVAGEPDRVDHQLHEAPVDPGHPLDRSLSAGSGRSHGLVERGERHGWVEAAQARPPDVVQGAGSIRMTLGEEVGRVPEQGRGGPVVAPIRRSAGARRIVPGSPEPQFAPGLVQRSELREEPVGLFQVVGEDLLELLDASLPDALEPVGEPLVQLGTERLGRGLVGGIADQLVAEPERVLARERSTGPAGSGRAGPGSSGSAAPPGRPPPATPPPRPRGTACRTPPPAGSPPARRR